MSKRKICGKGLLIDKVRVSFNNHRDSILRIFEENETASSHYEDLELGDKISFGEYIKYKLCKHHDMHDVDVNSDRYKYRICSKCNKSKYISLETVEQIQVRWKIAHKNSKLDEINELHDEIIRKEKQLLKMKMEYKADYGEIIQ